MAILNIDSWSIIVNWNSIMTYSLARYISIEIFGIEFNSIQFKNNILLLCSKTFHLLIISNRLTYLYIAIGVDMRVTGYYYICDSVASRCMQCLEQNGHPFENRRQVWKTYLSSSHYIVNYITKKIVDTFFASHSNALFQRIDPNVWNSSWEAARKVNHVKRC